MSEEAPKQGQDEQELGPEELEQVNGGTHVSKIEALTIKQKVVENDVSIDLVSKK